MIEKVNIQGFKIIEDETFELDRMNVFIGSNNSGKSSVLQAIQFAVGTAQTGQRIGVRSKKGSPIISFTANPSSFLYLPIIELEALIHDKKLTQSSGAKITFFSDKGDSSITIKRGKNRNLSMTMTQSALLDDLQNCQTPFCVYTPGLSGISISEEYKNKAVVLKSATRGDSNFYLRNILYLLKEKPEWESFKKAFNQFFPDYSIDVKFNPDEDETIDAYVEKHLSMKDSIFLPIDAMGTSALQILQILSYVYYFAPPMLILDEPDTHLHPNNQRRLISILNDFTKSHNMQVLISTHSRHIIDEVRNDASFFWMQNGCLAKKIRPSSDDSYDDIISVLLELGAMDVLDFSTPNIKFLVCTEDARVETDHYIRTILEASNMDLSTVKFVPFNGCGKIESVKLLKHFINQFHPDWRIVIHRDSDYLNEEEKNEIRDDFSKEGLPIWFTPGTDIESIFVNKNHIKAIFPHLSNDEIDELFNTVFSSIDPISIDKISKHIQEVGKKKDPGHTYGVTELNSLSEETFKSNPPRYRYGKKALSILKAELQNKLKHNPNIIQPSDYIQQPELTALLL